MLCMCDQWYVAGLTPVTVTRHVVHTTHASFSKQCNLVLVKGLGRWIWVCHSGGPPFRRSAIPGVCHSLTLTPNPNPRWTSGMVTPGIACRYWEGDRT